MTEILSEKENRIKVKKEKRDASTSTEKELYRKSSLKDFATQSTFPAKEIKFEISAKKSQKSPGKRE